MLLELGEEPSFGEEPGFFWVPGLQLIPHPLASNVTSESQSTKRKD